MPTKQELMDMMDNRLPGEALPLRNTVPGQPPAYPDLERVSYASQHHMEYQQHQQQQQQFMPEQIYTIRQPTTTINIQAPQFGTRSQLANCPMCHATQMTRCDYKSSMMTHIIATILGITTCCCCLPYCFDSCKSARHYCQNCGSYLGGHTK